MGLTINAKNCSFQNTIDDLSIKASRTIFSIKNKIKLTQLPPKLAKRIFQFQIVPILLYGSEVWGPYMKLDYATWYRGKTERVQTQFLKQVLGCNIQTSNNMVRADVGVRPLVNAIIKRFISYTNNLQNRKSDLCYVSTYEFESSNSEFPNFCKFTENFNIDIREILEKSKSEINRICNENYDRFWSSNIKESTKATSSTQFKTNVFLEPHFALNFNTK